MLSARFWVFAGVIAVPAGGMHDFQGAYDRLDLALQAGASYVRRSTLPGWSHIVDVETRQIIAGTKQQGDGAPRLRLPPERLYHG
jgi:hypothetical protein